MAEDGSGIGPIQWIDELVKVTGHSECRRIVLIEKGCTAVHQREAHHAFGGQSPLLWIGVVGK